MVSCNLKVHSYWKLLDHTADNQENLSNLVTNETWFHKGYPDEKQEITLEKNAAWQSDIGQRTHEYNMLCECVTSVLPSSNLLNTVTCI